MYKKSTSYATILKDFYTNVLTERKEVIRQFDVPWLQEVAMNQDQAFTNITKTLN
jgi:hypothetical protein